VVTDLPFSAWSLAKLADFLVAEGWSMTSATRGSGSCSARKASPFQRLKTWKASKDPRYAGRKARIEHLYAVAEPALALALQKTV
jgi:hypothetical protein